MTTSLLLSILGILALQVVSAFFSASETALTAASRARMHLLESEGVKRAAAVNALLAQRERMIGAILFGNNFINVLASALATSVALSVFRQNGVAIATAVMTVVILVFAEVLPKTLAITRTDRIALSVAPPMRVIVAILAPLVRLVQFFVWKLLNLFGVRSGPGVPVLTATEEIRGAIDLHLKEGSVEREHRDMLGGVLDLNELEVSDVMVHRKNIVAIDADNPVDQTVESVLSSGHTRFPIFRGEPENIVGVLHIKDLLRAMARRGGSHEGIDIMALASDPWFVPETTALDEQVHAFRQRRAHFALVVDEYGTLQGLVTLEDILEEVFGDIAEAHDTVTPAGIRPQPDGSFNVDGVTPVRELNRELHWELPDDIATTVAGLVIHEAQTIPEVGQKFSFYGFTFEVLRRQRNQLTALRIRPTGDLRDAPADARPA